LGHRDSVEGHFLSVHDDFVLLTVGAAFYVIGYPSTHSCPVMCLACLPDGFVSPRVASGRVVMYEGHQLSFGCFGGRCDDSFNE